MDEISGGTVNARAPLLEEFVRCQNSHPPHVPGWIVPAGWITFLVIAISSELIDPSGDVIPALGALAGWGLVLFLRHHFRAKTDHERRDERYHEVIRKLKWAQSQTGGLKKHLPEQVIAALEKVIKTYQLNIATFSADGSLATSESALRASILAINPVLRAKGMSRKDWSTICDDYRLIHGVTDALHEQTLILRESKPLDPARLAALAELERDTNPVNLREY